MSKHFYCRSGIILMVLTLLFFTKAGAQTYVPVDAGAKVEVTFQGGTGENIKKVKAVFPGLFGLIQFDPAHPEKASFDITVNTSSLRADKAYEYRFKGLEFFQASKYPTLQLKSTAVSQDNPGSIVYVISGTITIKAVTKPVRIQLTATKSASGYVFRGFFMFSRKTFGMESDGEFDDLTSVYLQIPTRKK